MHDVFACAYVRLCEASSSKDILCVIHQTGVGGAALLPRNGSPSLGTPVSEGPKNVCFLFYLLQYDDVHVIIL